MVFLFKKCSFRLQRLLKDVYVIMTDKAMMTILNLLKDVFKYAKVHYSFYEKNKVIYKFDLNYTKIDACSKNCMLYWKEEIFLEICRHCKGFILLSLETKVAKVIHVYQNNNVYVMTCFK